MPRRRRRKDAAPTKSRSPSPSFRTVQHLHQRRMEAARALIAVANQDPKNRRNVDLANAAEEYVDAKRAHQAATDAFLAWQKKDREAVEENGSRVESVPGGDGEE